MNENASLRGVLRGIGGAIASAGALGAAGTVSAETRRSGGSDYTYEPKVAFEGVSYDRAGRRGALLENVVYDDPAACRIGDVHYILHDGSGSYDVRDDASTSDVGVTVARLDEVYLDTTIPVANGDATLYQQAFVNETEHTPTLLIENELTLPGGEYGVSTLANPEIGDGNNDAYLTSQGYYDVLVATDGTYYAAFVQRQDWRKAFDDQHVGVEGVTSGDDKSAWRDAYVESDWSLDTNEGNSGDIDLAFDLYVGSASEFTWTTAIGFGTGESAAVDRAVSALESGFDSERRASYY